MFQNLNARSRSLSCRGLRNDHLYQHTCRPSQLWQMTIQNGRGQNSKSIDIHANRAALAITADVDALQMSLEKYWVIRTVRDV